MQSLDMAMIPSPLHLWATFALIAAAIYLYASEKLHVIVASVVILSAFLMLFHFAPLELADKTFNSRDLLSGFSDPALLAVISLLVIGQAVIRSGALNGVSNFILRFSKISPYFAIIFLLFIVTFVSSFINDTPTLVMFMPVMLAVAANLGISASKVMIPLSYTAILGGVTTLVGSSTNLLVSGAVVAMGLPALGMFDFTLPGAIIASIGFIYIAFVLPKILPNRAPLADVITEGGRQFVAQLEIAEGSELVGKSIRTEKLFGEEEVTIRMLQRYEQAFLAPFDRDIVIKSGDIIIVVATRESIKKLISEKGKVLFKLHSTLPTEDTEGEEKRTLLDESALAEILVTPGSRLLGQTVEQVAFHHNYHCIVMGIQRKARMITARMTNIRLSAGDVLLVVGTRRDIRKLRNNKDMVLMEWATEDLPSKKYALRVNLIFATVIGTAAAGLLPIHIGAIAGAALAVLCGCLNVRQAMRAIEAPIIFLVATGMAMAVALEKTGGAAFLAQAIITLMDGFSPVAIMSALFLLIAMVTNLLSNNATALLFTPIAINTAQRLGVPPEMFIFAVIFASNSCSLATPISFQTNLLVMGPGHYKFNDYMRAGIPLILIVWLTYTTFSYFYFG